MQDEKKEGVSVKKDKDRDHWLRGDQSYLYPGYSETL